MTRKELKELSDINCKLRVLEGVLGYAKGMVIKQEVVDILVFPEERIING